jgi:regulator of protease activity HflC (stomatin/prohibitin superfamily)
MDFDTIFSLALGLIIALVVWKGFKIVPQQQAWIVERFGKYDRKLEPGLNILIPVYENIAYRFSMKEMALDVPEQAVITRDNVPLRIDGVIYVRIVDPTSAAYGVSDPIFAITQLAQTTMRSEIGKMTMDQTFEEREALNTSIVNAINQAADAWGIQGMRYEIKNINPPATVIKAMEAQVTAERHKRAEILESEGKRQSAINIAEGQKQEVVLESEAAMTDQINRAKGEAEAILAVADATAKGITLVADSIKQEGGDEAVALKVAEKYVEAFGKLAQESTTLLLPANANDAGSMVAQAMTIFDRIKEDRTGGMTKARPWDASSS